MGKEDKAGTIVVNETLIKWHGDKVVDACADNRCKDGERFSLLCSQHAIPHVVVPFSVVVKDLRTVKLGVVDMMSNASYVIRRITYRGIVCKCFRITNHVPNICNPGPSTDGNTTTLIAVIVVCALLVLTVILVSMYIVWKNKKQVPFDSNYYCTMMLISFGN